MANRSIQRSYKRPFQDSYHLQEEELNNKSLLTDKVLYPITIWSICSMLYFVLKWFYFIANPPSTLTYNSVELRIYLFGSGLNNFVIGFNCLQWLPPKMAKNKSSKFVVPISIWMFATIYFGMSLFCVELMNEYKKDYFSIVWIVLIVANGVGAISMFAMHRKMDKYIIMPLADFCKALAFILIYTHL